MAIINTRPGRNKGKKGSNAHGLRTDWKKNKPSTSGVTDAAKDDSEMGGAIDEPMVKFGGMMSEDEDGEVEHMAIESRGGQKFSKVKAQCTV